MTLPVDFTNYTQALNVHPAAHNDVNAAVNTLTTDLALATRARFDVKAYGAVGDGTTDDGPAIQDAIDAAALVGGTVVFSDEATYQVATSLVIKTGVRFEGTANRTGTSGSMIRSATTDLFTLTATASGVTFTGIRFRSATGGGHIFNLGSTYTVSRWQVSDCFFHQQNDAKSAVHCGLEMLECRWTDCGAQHTATATVPTVYLASAIYAINVNVFDGWRFLDSGMYSIHIESTDAGGYCQDNVIRNVNFEQCEGGEIRLLSCRNTLVENVAGYDATTYTRSRVYVGKSTTGPTSRNVTLRQVARRGSPSMGSVYDIECQVSGASRTTVAGCNGLINLGSTESNIVLGLDSSTPAATLSNVHGSTVVIDNGAVTVGTYTIGEADIREQAARPTGALVETFPRAYFAGWGATGALTSQQLQMCFVPLVAGKTYTSVSVRAGTTAMAGGTFQSAGIYNLALARQVASTVLTDATWTASTFKTFTFTAPYTPTTSGFYYVGLVVEASTMPSLSTASGTQGAMAIAPVMHGTSTTGIASGVLPSTAAAITATAAPFYAYLS